MKPTLKWLLLPPIAALLLVLGPLSMQGGGPSSTKAQRTEAATPAAPADEGVRPGRAAPPVPRVPDLWQITSALVGVLLLGAVGVMMLRRLRGPAPGRRTTTLVTLRQTLRLSARQAVHALEFDDRILLVGQHERGLVLLESGRLPDRVCDEAELRNRHTNAAAEPDADDGAVPKDLIIPRPATAPARRLPTPPAVQAARSPTGLNDFRSLLQKAGRS
ncbi:MAG TPA: hypothetical protein VFZ65_17925 [Planctomycetota bacterium]|nr:hypothetical protein [Planctomycetota bacterium]